MPRQQTQQPARAPKRRSRPLTAGDVEPVVEVEAVPEIEPAPLLADDAPVIEAHAAPPPAAESLALRRQRFAEGLRALRVGGGTLNFSERTLMIVGGVIAPIGLVLVLLGWWGASHTPNLFEQVPYLISGGLFGLGLVFLGAFFYFAHWVTELVKESRNQAAAVVAAIDRLQTHLDRQSGLERAGADPSPNGRLALVATGRGTMAHRPECVVVSGKTDLRTVEESDGLLACKLCDPYGD